MLDTDPYRDNAGQYDRWFEKNRFVYDAELRAVRSLLGPAGRPGIEVGAGTGRFAKPLGIKIGIEPSAGMGKMARARGVEVIRGIAENLPLKNSTAGSVLMVTTICFVNDIRETFKESFRVLYEGGVVIIGMIDRGSRIGQKYSKHKRDSLFYKQATFYSVDEVLGILERTGFRDFDFRQTIFHDISCITEKEIVKTGYGEGLFVAVRGKK